MDIGANNGGMRGHFYLNGVDLGRYWGIDQGGSPVQRFYYLPVDVVRTHLNRLTLVSANLCSSELGFGLIVLAAGDGGGRLP